MRVYIIDNYNYLKNFSKIPAYVKDLSMPKGHRQVGEIQIVATGFIPILDGCDVDWHGRKRSGEKSIFDITELDEALKRLGKALQLKASQKQLIVNQEQIL